MGKRTKKTIQKTLRSEKGGLTVEASVALPLFVLTVYLLLYLIQIALIHNRMQQALTEVAFETGHYITAYMKTGIDEEVDTVFNLLYRLLQKINSEQGDPEAFLQYDKPVTSFFASVIKQKARDGLSNVVFRNMIKKYLSDGKGVRKNPEFVGIAGGIDGLDFSGSKILEDQRTLELTVRYEIQPVINAGNWIRFQMENTVAIIPWQEGGNADSIKEEAFSAWVDLSPVDRGMYIIDREIAGFLNRNKDKEIVIYNGKAFKAGVLFSRSDVFEEIVNIRSIDCTLPSYRNETVFIETVMEEIRDTGTPNRFKDFNTGRLLKMDNNTKRTLIVVLPEGVTISDTILHPCREYARLWDVNLVFKYAYGKPKNGTGIFFFGDSNDNDFEKPLLNGSPAEKAR